jgi:hypothetical protein
MENIMSEDHEVPETGPVGVDDVLAAIQQKNLAQARNHFNDLMGVKVTDALEAEKVRIANTVFNDAEEEEVETEDEDEVTSEEDVDVESEVEDIFAEDEETVE